MNTVKIGVVGTGEISYSYLNNMTKTFGITEVVGCSDARDDFSKRRAEQFNIRKMSNEEIYSDPDIEIVVNLTPPLAHYEVQKDAIAAGKNVYSEKMMAKNFPLAKELYDLAAAKGVRLGFAPDTFLGAGLQTARKLIDSGLIGVPFGAQAMVIRGYHMTGEGTTDALSFIFKEGGNISYDMGGYYIHALVSLLGPVNRVTGFTRQFRPYTQRNPRHPDYKKDQNINLDNLFTGALEFENGVLANLTCMSESHMMEVPRLEIYGDEGTLILPDPNTSLGPLYLVRGAGNFGDKVAVPLTHGYGSVLVPDPGESATPEERNWRNSYRGIGVCDMAWAIRNGRAHRCSAELGLHTIEVVHGVHESSKSGTVYKMTTTVKQPDALPTGFISGTASEAVFDTK